jgi:hypothetical protein
MKELPKMYQNKINKDIKNSQDIYNSLNDREEVIPRKINREYFDSYIIEQKIYNIFNSKDYIYKADVTIVTKDGLVNKRIVGKNKDNLITIDNEYIPISSIRDIYKNN